MTDETNVTTPELEQILSEVQKEWDIGGMDSSTIYGEFAIEVARRAVLAEREAFAKWYAEKWWLLDEDDVPDAMRKRSTNASDSATDNRERTMYELPKDGQRVQVKTARGVRQARFDLSSWCFWYTDCNHPAQNAHCAVGDVEAWTPATAAMPYEAGDRR